MLNKDWIWKGDLLTWLQGAGQWGPDLRLVLFQSSLSSWMLGFSLPIMQLTFIMSVPGSWSSPVHLLASFTLRTSPPSSPLTASSWPFSSLTSVYPGLSALLTLLPASVLTSHCTKKIIPLGCSSSSSHHQNDNLPPFRPSSLTFSSL